MKSRASRSRSSTPLLTHNTLIVQQVSAGNDVDEVERTEPIIDTDQVRGSNTDEQCVHVQSCVRIRSHGPRYARYPISIVSGRYRWCLRGQGTAYVGSRKPSTHQQLWYCRLWYYQADALTDTSFRGEVRSRVQYRRPYTEESSAYQLSVPTHEAIATHASTGCPREGRTAHHASGGAQAALVYSYCSLLALLNGDAGAEGY